MDTKTKFRCECNNRVYASQKTLDAHKKTDSHWANMRAKNGNAVAIVHTCECSGKTYPTKSRYNQHLKSEKHKYWALKIEVKKLREELTRKEIKLGKKKSKIEALEESNLTLLKELSSIRKRKKRRRKHKKTKTLKDID